MIIGKQDIILFYEYFYSRKYGNPVYKFKPSEKADQIIENFLLSLDKEYNLLCLGQIFLTRYFTFQFKRVENQVFKRFSSKDKGGKVQIYDIIGQKAMEYWKKRDKKFDFIISNPIDIINRVQEEKSLLTNKSEEIEKQRFVNTNRGFINCIERTTLFDHLSMTCIFCSFKNDCKKILEQNYNNIYIARGYGRNATAR